MPRLQWVNLTQSPDWLDNGITEVGQCGTDVRFSVQFQHADRMGTAFVSCTADSENVAYSPTEKRRRPRGFVGQTFQRRQMSTSGGTLAVGTRVTLAGGDTFTISVTDNHGTQIDLEEIQTRRKLYYQILTMDQVAAFPQADRRALEANYWNEADRLYLKLVELTPTGGALPWHVNVDGSDENAVTRLRDEVRANFNGKKSPYAFIIVFVNKCGQSAEQAGARTIQWGQPPPEDAQASQGAADDLDAGDQGPPAGAQSAPNAATSTSGTTQLNLFGELQPLFDFVDPAVDYFVSMRFRYQGQWYDVPRSRLTRTGRSGVIVDHSADPPFPTGVDVQLEWRMRMLPHNSSGLTFVGQNLITIAAKRSDDDSVNSAQILRMAVAHEVGHMIGLVADGTRAVDAEPTLYQGHGHHGPHCFHNISPPLPADFHTYQGSERPDCAMFGSSKLAPTTSFCKHCKWAIRKLDLRAATNPNFGHAF